MDLLIRKKINPNDFRVMKSTQGDQKYLAKDGKLCFFIPDEFVEDIQALLSMAKASYNIAISPNDDLAEKDRLWHELAKDQLGGK